MENKKISVVSNVIMPAITGIVTIVLFLLFKKADSGSLFWMNLIYTLCLEAILFVYVGIKKQSNTVSSVFYSVFGVSGMIYIIAGVLWMVIYSEFLSPAVSLRVYVAVILIISLLWFILSAFVLKNDASYKENTDDLKTKQNTLLYYSETLKTLCGKYERICAEKGMVYKTDSNNTSVLQNLVQKVSFLTPNVANNNLAVTKLQSIIEQCKTIISETESATETDKERLQKKMNDFVSDSILEIELIKNISKR